VKLKHLIGTGQMVYANLQKKSVITLGLGGEVIVTGVAGRVNNE
jgi:hypothetical protein